MRESTASWSRSHRRKCWPLIPFWPPFVWPCRHTRVREGMVERQPAIGAPSTAQCLDQQDRGLHAPADLDLVALVVERVGLGGGDLEEAVPAADIAIGEELQVGLGASRCVLPLCRRSSNVCGASNCSRCCRFHEPRSPPDVLTPSVSVPLFCLIDSRVTPLGISCGPLSPARGAESATH
jgi:hypothetical protein